MKKFWNGKKVLAFIALRHHTRFIKPIMEYLAGKGAQVEYIIGQGESPQELTAMELGLQFRHLFDYVGEDDREDVLKNYIIQRDTLSQSLRQDYSLAAQLVTVTDRSIWSAAKEYIGFRNLIKEERPDLCLALHELNRWGKTLGFWAKKQNIPYITLQEGLYYGQSIGLVGHVQFSTANLVWGEVTRKKLSQFEAPTDRIIPVGNTHLAREIELLQTNNTRTKMRKKYQCQEAFAVLLFLPPNPPPSKEYRPLFDLFPQRMDRRLFLKWHPTVRNLFIRDWFEAIPRRLRTKIVNIHGEESPYDLMDMSDLCVLTVPSTTGLEALAIGKPLVQLQFSKPPDMPYSFVEKGVALPFTPAELAQALEKDTDFDSMMDRNAITNYLKGELYATQGVTEHIATIAKKLIQAKEAAPPCQLRPRTKSCMDWTIIVAVYADTAVFLSQIEAIAKHSNGQGTYEVLLLEPADLKEDVLEILKNLGGDIKRLPIPGEKSLPDAINMAAAAARGKTLLLFDPSGTAPEENWLYNIREAIEKYGSQRLFGVRIENPFGSLIHAGMVLNPNHAPVSAYEHLATDFPAALKERPFQLLDYFIAINREFFLELGGLGPKMGRYAFMDLCLRAREKSGNEDVAIYLPRVRFIQLVEKRRKLDVDAAIEFYGRWHGTLWDNEDRLYNQDGISRMEVQAALMKRLVALEQARQAL